MTLRGVEPAVDALRDRLAADLPAAITTINNDVTDGYTIEAPQQVLDYVPPLDQLNVFPTVCVDHQGVGKLEDDSGFEATGHYPLGVVSVIQEADHQALARKIRRYTLAVTRVAMEDRNLGSGTGIPWGVVLDSIGYGPSLDGTEPGDSPDPPRSYWTFSVVTIRVKLDEV